MKRITIMDDPGKESREALQNFIRLSLLMDQGTEILRQIFRSRYRHMTQEEWRGDECPKSGKIFVVNFGKRLDKLNLCKLQRQMIDRGNLDSWDLATLAALLDHLDDDTSAMKMENLSIRMLSRVANSCAHLSSTRVSDEKFEYLWTTAVMELIFLGGNSNIFDHILATPISTSCTKSFQCDDDDDHDDEEEEDRFDLAVHDGQWPSSRRNSMTFLPPEKELETSEKEVEDKSEGPGTVQSIPKVRVTGPDDLTPKVPVTSDDGPTTPVEEPEEVTIIPPRKTTKLTTVRVWEIQDGIIQPLPMDKGGVSKWPKIVGNKEDKRPAKNDGDLDTAKNEEIHDHGHSQPSTVTKRDVGTWTGQKTDSAEHDDGLILFSKRSYSSCPTSPIIRRHGSFVCGSSPEVRAIKKSPVTVIRKRCPVLEANGYARDKPTSYALVGPTILSNSIILHQGTTAIVSGDKQLRLKANHILPLVGS